MAKLGAPVVVSTWNAHPVESPNPWDFSKIAARESDWFLIPFIQKSAVKPGFCGFRLLLCGITAPSPSLLKLKACPTFPAANQAPFWSVPLLLPLISFAFPSPDHQLTIFGGGGAHVCSTAWFVGNSPRIAALASKQGTTALLTWLIITPFASFLTFLIADSFCPAPYR